MSLTIFPRLWVSLVARSIRNPLFARLLLEAANLRYNGFLYIHISCWTQFSLESRACLFRTCLSYQKVCWNVKMEDFENERGFTV